MSFISEASSGPDIKSTKTSQQFHNESSRAGHDRSTAAFIQDFRNPSGRLVAGISILWLFIAIISLWRGPAMSDHEVIVAQTARQSIETNSWIVPHYLDTPFLVKPPMPAWLVGLATETANTLGGRFGLSSDGAPVNVFTARLPSFLATLVTILVLFRLAQAMYDRRTAFMAAFLYASSLGAMLYAFNATAEALLTLFSTWALAEFWHAQAAGTARGRRIHMLLFYVAFGLAMLAKGPMPLMLVATPIAVWWWCNRPARLLAAGGVRSVGAAVRLGAVDSWPKLRKALTTLGLWWGVPIFLAMFVPWMIAVARRVPYAWDLWNYEYFDRLQGDYPGCESGQYYYYLPIIMGLTVPWLLSMPEAIAAPFLQKYRRDRKPLLFAWFWVIVGTAIMSMMSFKKPYYIVPVLPGCALLLAPVLRHFFFSVSRASERHMRIAYYGILAVWAVGWSAMWFVAHAKYPQIWTGNLALYSPIFVLLTTLAVAWVGALYLKGRRFSSFVTLGITGMVSFGLVWSTAGARLDNLEDPMELVTKLRDHHITPDAAVFWAGNRPDGRVVFYGNRKIKQILDPYMLVANHEEAHDDEELLQYAASKVVDLLQGSNQVYVVFQRGQIDAIRLYYEPDPPMQEMFDIDRGKQGRDEDDWVVVTNELSAAAFIDE